MDKNIINKTVKLFLNSEKIIFFTGAGISTSCGIPDFRGPDGLYSFAQKKYNLPYPEAVFDINYFSTNPKPFFELSKDFFSNYIEPSITHKFVAWLEEINKVSLVMTQNIDMLHQRACSKNVCECHGTYTTGHCTKCRKIFTLKEYSDSLEKGEVFKCFCGGIVKPDIVFFGEQLPRSFFQAYQNPPDCDLLVVMGTSLSVQPASSFQLKLVNTCESIIINLTETDYDRLFTYKIKSNLDDFAKIIQEAMNKEM